MDTVDFDSFVFVILDGWGFVGVVVIMNPFKLLKEATILLQVLKMNFFVLTYNAWLSHHHSHFSLDLLQHIVGAYIVWKIS